MLRAAAARSSGGGDAGDAEGPAFRETRKLRDVTADIRSIDRLAAGAGRFLTDFHKGDLMSTLDGWDGWDGWAGWDGGDGWEGWAGWDGWDGWGRRD